MQTIHTEEYYPALKHMINVFDRAARKMRLLAATTPEFVAWKANVRAKLADITGLSRMETCSLSPRLLESVHMDGYRRDKLVIQTEPDIWMTFYVLIPDTLREGDRLPCVIAPHGHISAGKYAPAGRTDIPALAGTIKQHNYDYGVQFVQRGYLVLCPDARGFGERREISQQSDEEYKFMNSSCTELNHLAICLGQSLTGMWTWDLMRLLDYMETREDCDIKNVACCGLSGGGLQTLWLSAMDDRIKCSVVSGYFYGYRDSLLRSFHCACNYVPGLWEAVDMGDLGALIAPRPLFIETGDKDTLNGDRGIVNTTEQAEITRQAYRLFDAEDLFIHHIFDGEHRWDGTKSYDFVQQWLRG